jgi:hypothetical protein
LQAGILAAILWGNDGRVGAKKGLFLLVAGAGGRWRRWRGKLDVGFLAYPLSTLVAIALPGAESNLESNCQIGRVPARLLVQANCKNFLILLNPEDAESAEGMAGFFFTTKSQPPSHQEHEGKEGE